MPRMSQLPPKPGYAAGTHVPAVIQRMVSGVIEWLTTDGTAPHEWSRTSGAAFVFSDIGFADRKAEEIKTELGGFVFAAVRERQALAVEAPHHGLPCRSERPVARRPFFSRPIRERRVREDWRTGKPNCGAD